MLSVFQACSASDGMAAACAPRADPLNQAITALIADRLPGAASARLRALTALLREQTQERPAHCRSVEQLADAVSADRRRAYEAVRTKSGGRRARGYPPPTGSMIMQAVRGTRGPRAERALREQLPVPKEERRKMPTTHVNYDPMTLVSEVTGSVQLRKKPQELAGIIDPRTWDDYNPVFEAAYRVELDQDGAVVFDNGGMPVELAEPNGRGEGWTGVLYEDVSWETDGGTASRFRNLLNIRFSSSPKRVQAKYALRRCLASQLWIVERPGGIDVDSGTWTARALRGGWTELRLVKRLRFTDATVRDASPMGWDFGQIMNYLTPAFLGMWIDAVLEGVVAFFDLEAAGGTTFSAA